MVESVVSPLDTPIAADPPISTAIGATAHTQKKLDALTTLRFFAAAFIVIGHAAPTFNVHYKVLDAFLGGQGVTFFYILSGFILTYVYPSLDRAGMQRFLVARLARIWPMYLAAIALLFLLIVFKANVTLDPVVVILNTFMLQSWVPVPHYYVSFNPIAWSVSVELFFYVCFPLLLWRWQRTWAVKLVVTFAMLCGMIALYNYGLRFLPKGSDVTGVVYTNPLARVFEFTIGVAIANIWMFARHRVRLPRSVGTVLELAAGGLVYFVGLHTGPWATRLQPLPFVHFGGLVWLVNGGLVLLPLALLVLVLALETGWVSRLLSLAPLVLLGEISYSIYLTHFTFVAFYGSHQDLFRVIPDSWLWPAYWAVLIASCYAFWALIEIPCRRGIVRWYDRRFSERPTRRPAAPARQWYVRLATAPTTRGALVAVLLVASLLGVARASAPPQSVAGLTRMDVGTAWAINISGADPNTTSPIPIARGTTPAVVGWAVDRANARNARGVLLSIDGTTNVPMRYGLANPGIVQAFNDPRYLRAGFSGTLPVAPLAPGDHVVTVRVLNLDGRTYFESHKFGITVT